jgi:AcrR family transcriptional regulator
LLCGIEEVVPVSRIAPRKHRVPRAKAPKRELLVRAAADLILQKGCAASSLADIAQAARVPVGNVYHYFKTKEALAEAVIDFRLAELRGVLAQADRHERPEQRIRHFLRFLIESRKELARHGCAFGGLNIELEKYDSRLGKKSRILMTAQLDWMREQFERMGKGRNAGALALVLLSRTQGSAVLAHELGDPSVVQTAVQEIGAWIEREASLPTASASAKQKAPVGARSSSGRQVSTSLLS